MTTQFNKTIFTLKATMNDDAIDRGQHPTFVVITDKPMDFQEMTQIWSHVIQESPKSIHVADYEAAVKLLQKLHPTWQVFGTHNQRIVDVGYNRKAADKYKESNS